MHDAVLSLTMLQNILGVALAELARIDGFDRLNLEYRLTPLITPEGENR